MSYELFVWAQVSFYHRNVARQQQQIQQWLQKRRQENATRRLAGEEALPEEDPALFKPIPEPSPLDGFLINNQVHITAVCHHMSNEPSQLLAVLWNCGATLGLLRILWSPS